MRILGIGHIGIASGDLGKHVETFGDKLRLEIHDIALRVADIEEAMRAARAAGLTVIDETPRPGAGGSRIAFLHPRSTGGILIHFVERPDPDSPKRTA